MKQGLIYAFVLFIIVGCTSSKDFILFNETNITQPQAKQTITTLKNIKFEYKIQPHDRISITMYNHPELGTSTVQSQREDTKGVLVNSRGYVRLPLIKSIHVAGLSQTAAQKKIEKAFSAYLEDAEVYLEVLNKRAYILGEINKPGIVPLFNEKLTLLQILAMAGDFTNYANKHSVVILKNRNNKVHSETVDLTGPNSLRLANIMIYPNDIVYVAPNSMKSYNVGISEISPTFGLLGHITQPLSNLASIRYLRDTRR